MSDAIWGTGDDGAVASRMRPVYKVQLTMEEKTEKMKKKNKSRGVVQIPTVIYLNDARYGRLRSFTKPDVSYVLLPYVPTLS